MLLRQSAAAGQGVPVLVLFPPLLWVLLQKERGLRWRAGAEGAMQGLGAGCTSASPLGSPRGLCVRDQGGRCQLLTWMRDLDQGRAGTEKRAGMLRREEAARHVQMGSSGGKRRRPGERKRCGRQVVPLPSWEQDGWHQDSSGKHWACQSKIS